MTEQAMAPHEAPLAPAEQTELERHEATIRAGKHVWIQVGTALAAIRDGRLYRATHKTFEAYCQEVHDFTHQRADQLVIAAATYTAMADDKHVCQDLLPENPLQAVALAKAPAAERAEVLREAAERTGGLTAKNIESVIIERAAKDDGGLMAYAMPELLEDGPAGDRLPDGTPIVRRNDLSALGSLMGKPQAPAPVKVDAEQAKPAVRNGDEWWTRADDVALVKAVLGEICLDPASCLKANETVGATEFYTLERGEDGLALPWNAPTIFINPPYSNTDAWIKRLVAEFHAGTFNEGIALVLAKTETEWFDLAWEFGSVCIVRSRISHVAGDGGNEQTGRTGSAFFYFGHNHARFADVFAHRGRVLPATPWVGRPAEKAVA